MRSFDWTGMWRPIWPPWEVALRAVLLYTFVQLLLRFAGRGRLGRHALPDFVALALITVAARESIVGSDTSLTSAFLGLFVLFALDRVVSSLMSRSPMFARLIEGVPRPLVRDGHFIDDELRRAHITREELLSQLRMRGKSHIEEVRAAFLEPDGQVSFLFREPPLDRG